MLLDLPAQDVLVLCKLQTKAKTCLGHASGLGAHKGNVLHDALAVFGLASARFARDDDAVVVALLDHRSVHALGKRILK